MESPEKISTEPERREYQENIVHKFFSEAKDDIEMVVNASKLSEAEKKIFLDFYVGFLEHLNDEAYIERSMVFTGSMQDMLKDDEEPPLRRVKLETGEYSIENALYVFAEDLNEAIYTGYNTMNRKRSDETKEVHKTIIELLEGHWRQ